ncbi:NAD-dependent protein deacetylase sirtuin-7 [Belonocnema kinseyi]|uniref:NAD-dependent protein deacetylase sirtuin-7 n=1 Tax=Belonocnema kinseyi TaxID=2817044 RepID=UPI00143D944A|nr:NAD-dependent protein deacetylase sirtuin-7 [Belonocnema kinseyi]XP_033213638.1 NAD-dependent protein deacetylase sirtuin-7 [Belonocnema kinseyi]
MEEDVKERLLSRRRSAALKSFKVKDERVATVKKVAAILQKPEESRSPEENEILVSCGDIVKEVNLRQKKRDRVKARLEEIEDAPEILEEKCMRLAAAISRATSLAVYTGAGISTAASIPDYRGTNGVWTRMQQGKDIGNHDLSQAEPTVTHMALYALYKARVLKHIVSQNCDGLHLRSGIPRSLLSEVHGNMYVEVCKTCKPSREYWRLFDVTEKTARYSHGTGRICHKCNSTLQDSIVHFGERGNLLWPINWSGASRAAKQADVILCLGSSLKVLKKYPWLWQMDRPMHKRSSLYIVNLQWTPKDENATLKINGKCDEVMRKVMLHLGIKIPEYNRGKDPIFHHAIRLQNVEQSTTTQPLLEEPVSSMEKSLIVVEEEEPEVIKVEPKSETDCVSQITLTEPMTAYPAPFFAALPFLSMGLPFPPMYMYPQLSPFLYYPFIQVPAISTETLKPKPACTFCMENEGSLTCLYYQRDGDDPVTMDALPQETETEMENNSSLEQIQEAEAMSLDANAPISTAKNPGWFGKGYRKGLKKKR